MPLVLLHGNGSMIEDFQSSGLIDLAATKYRVIAFDRPGFGHTPRPRSTIWTPEAQADLIAAALKERLRNGERIHFFFRSARHKWFDKGAIITGE
jgi:pimeloyl-ACP methyl ester carboxylesterase